MLSMQKDANYQVLDYKEAFRLATLGGSQGIKLLLFNIMPPLGSVLQNYQINETN